MKEYPQKDKIKSLEDLRLKSDIKNRIYLCLYPDILGKENNKNIAINQ